MKSQSPSFFKYFFLRSNFLVSFCKKMFYCNYILCWLSKSCFKELFYSFIAQLHFTTPIKSIFCVEIFVKGIFNIIGQNLRLLFTYRVFFTSYEISFHQNIHCWTNLIGTHCKVQKIFINCSILLNVKFIFVTLMKIRNIRSTLHQTL